MQISTKYSEITKEEIPQSTCLHQGWNKFVKDPDKTLFCNVHTKNMYGRGRMTVKPYYSPDIRCLGYNNY